MHRNLHFLASAAIIAAVFGGNVPGANRLASLGKTGRLFSFTHISKTGGASFVHWATRSSGKENFAEFFPVLAAGVEEGFLFDRKQHPNAIHLTLLRDPRSHVLSLYKECRFGTWGMKVWAQAIEEQQPWASGTQLEGLDAFVSFYQEPGGKEWLNCYEPWNFQARALTSDSKKPRNVDNSTGKGIFEPSFAAATESYFAFDWVGNTNFFHESRCLLVGRLEAPGSRSTTFLEETCRCNADGNPPPSREEHLIHGKKMYQSEVPLSPELKAKIDRLTRVDAQLFIVAIKQFFAEVKWLESKLGRRVMCNGTLERARDKLLYLVDVVAEYRLSEALRA